MLIQFIFLTWGAINGIAALALIGAGWQERDWSYISEYDFTPWSIYKTTEFNMFGCIVLFLLGIILVPVYYLILFVYFIFHIGRKKGE